MPLLWLGHKSHATTVAAHAAGAPPLSLLASCSISASIPKLLVSLIITVYEISINSHIAFGCRATTVCVNHYKLSQLNKCHGTVAVYQKAISKNKVDLKKNTTMHLRDAESGGTRSATRYPHNVGEWFRFRNHDKKNSVLVNPPHQDFYPHQQLSQGKQPHPEPGINNNRNGIMDSNGGKRHLSQAPSREEKGRLKSGWQTRLASSYEV
ncbi:hypothetical protein LXL04_034078 [Taraxacum kok-saghyz]